LKAAVFEYHRPASAEAAVEMLAELGEDAKVLANAVRDALAPLGVRITTQPLTPDRLVSLINSAAAGSR